MADPIGSGFENIYAIIKNYVVQEMEVKKGGEIVIPVQDIPTFISEAWLNISVKKLLEELKDQYGIADVCIQLPNPARDIVKAIIVKG